MVKITVDIFMSAFTWIRKNMLIQAGIVSMQLMLEKAFIIYDSWNCAVVGAIIVSARIVYGAGSMTWYGVRLSVS